MVTAFMPMDAGPALDRLRDQLQDGERDVSPPAADHLLTFSDRMDLQQLSAERNEKLLRHCTIIAEETGKLLDALDDRDAAEAIVRWNNRRNTNEETNRDYRVALREFGKYVTDGDDIPDSIAWIKATTSRDYNPAPDPTEMLDWEDDVLPMIDATMNARDAALIAVAWDAGSRAGELLGLRVGDVTDHDYGLQITVDGKQGQRSITLIPSVPYLNRWLQDHPRRDDDTAPLWCKLQSGEEMSYQMCRKIPREAADRADVTKPVTFTNFRKSSASYLASQGVNQAVLEDHHGWSQGSDVAARYVSVFADASDRALAKAHGKDVEEAEPEPIASVTCPRCEKETPRNEPFCMWCNQAIEHGAVDEIEETQQAERRQLLGLAKEHPELLDRLEEMEPLIDVLGGDPDVIETAQRFVEETRE
ncbi:MAG: site-specific integrase [Candidatus Nanohaloarchaea archaeon]|nr:site-specific integrase [Candidatus Nanohaloarchaea archaeon]